MTTWTPAMRRRRRTVRTLAAIGNALQELFELPGALPAAMLDQAIQAHAQDRIDDAALYRLVLPLVALQRALTLPSTLLGHLLWLTPIYRRGR